MTPAYPMFISEVSLEDIVVTLQVGLISSITPLGATQCKVRMSNGDTFGLKRTPHEMLGQIRTGSGVCVALDSSDGEGH